MVYHFIPIPNLKSQYRFLISILLILVLTKFLIQRAIALVKRYFLELKRIKSYHHRILGRGRLGSLSTENNFYLTKNNQKSYDKILNVDDPNRTDKSILFVRYYFCVGR